VPHQPVKRKITSNIAATNQSSDVGVRAISFPARRKEAVEPLPAMPYNTTGELQCARDHFDIWLAVTIKVVVATSEAIQARRLKKVVTAQLTLEKRHPCVQKWSLTLASS